MLKRIPKSDISIRPFKAYKEWEFDNNSQEVSVLEAIAGDYANVLTNEISGGILSGSSYDTNALYGQLRSMFYNGNETNPFLRFGDISIEYNVETNTKDRFLSGSAKVISIPQKYVGEGIKKNSVVFTDNDVVFNDDGYGNLLSLTGDNILISRIDAELSIFNFVDIEFVEYSASLATFPTFALDLQNNILTIIYQSVEYKLNIISGDIESGIIIVENIEFLLGAAGLNKVGNVFYTQGLIVLTRGVDKLLLTNWDIKYKSTQTIYENEYLLITDPDEFNISQNPSAIITVGEERSTSIDTDGTIKRITTNPGVKYIRKRSILENGSVIDYRYTSSVQSDVYAGFEQIDISGSIDSTGSFLSPFITTIGLYDDNCDLVAVAKLPQPIKTQQDFPINFIVRFDT
jgi:hypothetical protein